ncbi:MAG: alpha/beta hydrolase [Streptosporangiaceae bacterium]|nr:alpha/beta hydrolase [Streptosporangiaceae bacterium]MBV9855234.1 alpha/beta hydrolase [Streptosporangiaceae bacterium]
MANQTSALITALGLKQPDVLGWSMGSMIAQALALLHPDQVHRLVLCASFPGNRTTVRPSQAAIEALNSGNSQKVVAGLDRDRRRGVDIRPGPDRELHVVRRVQRPGR